MPAPDSTSPLSPSMQPFFEAIFGQCQLQLHDFQHAVRHEPKTRLLLRAASLVSATSLLTAAALSALGHTQWAVVSGVLAFLLLAVHQMPDVQASRWFHRTPAKARSLRYTFNADGLIVISELAQRMYTYRELYAFEQTTLTLLLWVSPKLFLIVPTRAFTPEDRKRVSRRLLATLGSGPPARSLGWRWLLLLSSAGAIWWAWQTFAPRPL